MLCGLLLSLGLLALTSAAPKLAQDDGPRMYDLPSEEASPFEDNGAVEPEAEEVEKEQSEVRNILELAKNP
ncbi:unnamed protein product [Cylicostephanus goldi]|uniref:Uncharacterized protein n=1 Tax=Cylicostephanus goldi TaxID=71465 RepID=A0A3P6SPA0_CYLGO|nr:unnamed protein product [Cylicostephanus goldi]